MLILASSSPRRKELLKKITTDFVVISPDIDEGALSFVPAKDLAAEESKEKAYAIKAKYPNDEIISCDTIVVLESGEVLGKPGNAENARKMLENESGKKQYVLSGYTYIGKGVEITRTIKSVVYFNKLSPELIEEYIEKKKPFDKAGAYGIQDEFGLIHHIEGSYDNVMGFPVEDIKKHCPIG